jgi:hypothetical protein
MEGDKGLVLTGQLGDVMKESARIALSYARSHGEELGIDPVGFQREFHLHVPAGAIPKDGPSAGTAMTTALVSLLSGRPVKHTVGMTGGHLQGSAADRRPKQKVLPHAAGLTEVILPGATGRFARCPTVRGHDLHPQRASRGGRRALEPARRAATSPQIRSCSRWAPGFARRREPSAPLTLATIYACSKALRASTSSGSRCRGLRRRCRAARQLEARDRAKDGPRPSPTPRAT